MGRIKRAFNGNFTMIHNEYLDDKRLGSTELGWLTFMLSRPDNWNFCIEGLAKTHSDGKTKIMSALKKLEECGYLKRTRIIDKSTGRVVDWLYEFSDESHPEWIEQQGKSETIDDVPHSDYPDVVNQSQSSTNQINTDYDESDSAAAPIDDEIQQVYQNYDALVKESIEYERLCTECGSKTVNRIKDVMLNVLMSPCNTIRIGKVDINANDAKECFMSIEYKHVKKIIAAISNKSIRSFSHYVTTALYNAVKDIRIQKPVEFQTYKTDNLAFYAEACDYSFNSKQMEYIENVMIGIVPFCGTDAEYNDVELVRYEYLRKIYLRMMAQDSQKHIRNKFSYFSAMLEKELSEKGKNKSICNVPAGDNGSHSYNLDLLLKHAMDNIPTIKN